MNKTFLNINRDHAKRIKLIMTDVDGTLLATGRAVSPSVAEALGALQQSGITLGLVSGRTLPELESMAIELGMKGPVIAENGAVAKLAAGEPLLELGYTRQPALDAFQKLQKLYPGSIQGREDNKVRIIDFVFRADGIPLSEIRKHIGNIQLLDSGYILHLMQEGISKGETLARLLESYDHGRYSTGDTMVFGDSATDASLFELFSDNVLILNPNLPEGQAELMRKKATYISELEYGEGFIQVALHIVQLRRSN